MNENVNTAEADVCCPKFDPGLWDGKLLVWDKKKFIRGKVFTLFYMPVNFAKVIVGMNKAVEAAGGAIPDWLCLSDHTSKWNMDLLLATDREIPGAANVEISGKFLVKVYEGPFKDTGKWCKDFESYAAQEGHAVKKMYMWYTTCPKCAKKYGKNYVAVVAEVGGA
jgi:hypothetical protein